MFNEKVRKFGVCELVGCRYGVELSMVGEMVGGKRALLTLKNTAKKKHSRKKKQPKKKRKVL